MSDNKCRACGQWAGKGHKCPTPVTTAPATVTAVQPRPSATVTQVSDRVARAQAALSAYPARRTEYIKAVHEAEKAVAEIRGTLSHDDSYEVGRQVSGSLWDSYRFTQGEDYDYEGMQRSADYLKYAREGARDLYLSDSDAADRIRAIVAQIPDPPLRSL